MLVRMDKSRIQLKYTNIINLISFLMPGASPGSLLAFSLAAAGWPGDTNKWSSQDYFKIMTLSKHRPAPPTAASHQDPPMGRLYMETQVGLKTIAIFLNLFFYILLQLLCVMISHWLGVLKHKMPSQILIKNAGLVWLMSCICNSME